MSASPQRGKTWGALMGEMADHFTPSLAMGQFPSRLVSSSSTSSSVVSAGEQDEVSAAECSVAASLEGDPDVPMPSIEEVPDSDIVMSSSDDTSEGATAPSVEILSVDPSLLVRSPVINDSSQVTSDETSSNKSSAEAATDTQSLSTTSYTVPEGAQGSENTSMERSASEHIQEEIEIPIEPSQDQKDTLMDELSLKASDTAMDSTLEREAGKLEDYEKAVLKLTSYDEDDDNNKDDVQESDVHEEFAYPTFENDGNEPSLTLDQLIALVIAQSESRSLTLIDICTKISTTCSYYHDISIKHTLETGAPSNHWTKRVEDVLHQYDFPTTPIFDPDDGILHFSLHPGREWFILPMPSKKTDEKAFRLMDLPAELRNMIYKLVLHHPLPPKQGWIIDADYTIDYKNAYHIYNRQAQYLTTRGPGDWELRTRRLDQVLALSLVNHVVHEESVPIFYRTNTFYFEAPKILGQFLLGIPNRTKFIRNVILKYDPPTYGHNCRRSLGELFSTKLRRFHLIINESAVMSKFGFDVCKEGIAQLPGLRILSELRGVYRISFHGDFELTRAYFKESQITEDKKDDSTDDDEIAEATAERRNKLKYKKFKRTVKNNAKEIKKIARVARKEAEKADRDDRRAERAKQKEAQRLMTEREREKRREAKEFEREERRRYKEEERDSKREEREHQSALRRREKDMLRKERQKVIQEKRDAKQARDVAKVKELRRKAKERERNRKGAGEESSEDESDGSSSAQSETDSDATPPPKVGPVSRSKPGPSCKPQTVMKKRPAPKEDRDTASEDSSSWSEDEPPAKTKRTAKGKQPVKRAPVAAKRGAMGSAKNVAKSAPKKAPAKNCSSGAASVKATLAKKKLKIVALDEEFCSD